MRCRECWPGHVRCGVGWVVPGMSCGCVTDMELWGWAVCMRACMHEALDLGMSSRHMALRIFLASSRGHVFKAHVHTFFKTSPPVSQSVSYK